MKRRHIRKPIPALTIAAALWGMLSVQSAIAPPGAAQTAPGTPPPNQSAGTPPSQPISPTPGVPANVLTPTTTNQLAPSTPSQPQQRVQPFGSAGRGLPGMPGGPPLKGSAGAQDPTADYMRPPVIGPLFCDPAVNIPC